MAGYHNLIFCKDAFSQRERGGADTEVIVVKGTAREMERSQTGLGADSDRIQKEEAEKCLGGSTTSLHTHNT